MANHSSIDSVSDIRATGAPSGAARHLRAAALSAALLPLAQIAATPVTVSAQCVPGVSGCPPDTTGSVPEPATLLLLAPAAAWLVRRRLKQK